MPQKLDTETGARVRPLDQARNIGDYECLVILDLHDPEIRLQRCKRVVGDLRLRRRNARDQRRLAGVRKADETDVGKQLQLQAQPALFAGTARLMLGRSLMRRRGEAGVAATAASAARRDEALAGFREIE